MDELNATPGGRAIGLAFRGQLMLYIVHINVCHLRIDDDRRPTWHKLSHKRAWGLALDSRLCVSTMHACDLP